MQESKKIPIILNWLGKDGFKFVKTPDNEEQEKCSKKTGLFKVLSDKFKAYQNQSILSLQYCNLSKEQNKNAKEKNGHLRIKENESKYKEKINKRTIY